VKLNLGGTIDLSDSDEEKEENKEEFDDHLKLANSMNHSIIGLNFSKPANI